MALGKQLPIRLELDVERRLEKVAAESGTTKSALIRFLAKTFVDQVERNGQVILPIDWAVLLPAADGRSSKAAATAGEGEKLKSKKLSAERKQP
ncbi:MAG: hypothetical protein ACFCU3_07855 [Verrucomicrobiales bacterium]